MLALRPSPRQVIVTNKQLNGTDMVGELLREGQRLAHQTGHALAQRVVEALDVIGFLRELVDRAVLCRRHHLFIYHILIRVKRGVLTDGRLAESWPTGARHLCGCDRPRERQ
jgi:hypothetical protein